MQYLRHRNAGTRLTTPDLAAALDANDPLKDFAAEFHYPFDAQGKKLIYLCGHSLGLQPKAVRDYVDQELRDWQRLGVLGHHEATRPWIGYHEHLARPLGCLVGAGETEVVAMNSLTVNLHLMMVSFFRPTGARNTLVIEKSAFPSDRYAVVSQLEFHGLDATQHLIELEPRPGERSLRTENVLATLEREGPRIALVLLPGVQYLTGQLLDLDTLIRATRRIGACVGLDLAHAIGNVPLKLHDWNADFAVWCSYKYLNAGPGAIGGCFVHERHGRDPTLARFAGWWGQRKAARFAMGPDFEPIEGAEGWQLSNPPVLATAPLLASLEIFERAGLARLREKSVRLTRFLQDAIEAALPDSVEIITPRAETERGSQLSLRLLRSPSEAKRIHDRLTELGVIGDWREPDIVRLTPISLYNSYADTYAAVTALVHAMHS